MVLPEIHVHTTHHDFTLDHHSTLDVNDNCATLTTHHNINDVNPHHDLGLSVDTNVQTCIDNGSASISFGGDINSAWSFY